MKVKTLIIDDETQARNSLASDLKKHDDKIQIIGEANSLDTAIKAIDNLKPDLLFLDINLGDGSGFNVLEKCTYKNFKVIFVTAYDQYAIKAFKVSAIDFLLKPVDADELSNAIAKVISEKTENEIADQMAVYKAYSSTTSGDRKIVLKEMDAMHIVKIENLLYCEASGIYTTFYTNTKQIVISKNLKEYEELLGPMGFLRVHNSFLVNGSKIESLEKGDGGFLIMEGGKRIPVSQRKKEVVINFLKSL